MNLFAANMYELFVYLTPDLNTCEKESTNDIVFWGPVRRLRDPCPQGEWS